MKEELKDELIYRLFQINKHNVDIISKLADYNQEIIDVIMLIRDIENDGPIGDTIKTLKAVWDKFKVMHDEYHIDSYNDLYMEGVMDGISIAVAKFKGCDIDGVKDDFGCWHEDQRVPEAYHIDRKE